MPYSEVGSPFVFELKPWKKVGWVIAPEASAEFVANMERGLDVYCRPHDPAHPVVCIDETPRQLIGQTRQSIAAKPGQPEREDYEYQRLGVCNVFILFSAFTQKKGNYSHPGNVP